MQANGVASGERRERGPQRAGKALRVLAADSSASELKVLGRYLSRIARWETEMSSFREPAECLAHVKGREFDLVFVDYGFGPDNGLQFLGQLRAAGVRAPAILLTNEGREERAVEAVRAGVYDYFVKGNLNASSLERTIGNAVDKYRLSRDLDDKRRDLESTLEQLHRSHEELDAFYNLVSHELKGPLAGVGEFLGLVLDGTLGALSPEQRQSLGVAARHHAEMVACVDDLLDARRLAEGGLELTFTPTELSELVQRALTVWEHKGARKDIEVHKTLGDDLPLVRIDARRVVQVLTNLMANAVEHTGPGGEISVTSHVASEAGFVRISVSDTGRGIARADHERIFERLRTAADSDGKGLGLNISRELVRLHGGELWVESELGQGSTFHLTLPIARTATVKRAA